MIAKRCIGRIRQWQAVCGCGYRGPWRTSCDPARQDDAEHDCGAKAQRRLRPRRGPKPPLGALRLFEDERRHKDEPC